MINLLVLTKMIGEGYKHHRTMLVRSPYRRVTSTTSGVKVTHTYIERFSGYMDTLELYGLTDAAIDSTISAGIFSLEVPTWWDLKTTG